MSSELIRTPPIPFRPVCIFMGVFFTSGALGYFNPVKGAKIYGRTLSTPAEATFYPAVSVRNVSLGATILAFVATGQVRTLGSLLLGFSIMAVGDMVFILRSPAPAPGSLVMHAVKVVLMPFVGAKLVGLC